jgi:hypothetical protein
MSPVGKVVQIITSTVYFYMLHHPEETGSASNLKLQKIIVKGFKY